MTDQDASRPDDQSIKEQYLVDYLEDEFEKNPKLRLRVIKEEQTRGVMVRSASREYFFPFSWAMSPELFKRVRDQVQEIQNLF